MKTEKFTELTVGYYKLVDKEVWLDCNKYNESLYSHFEPNNLIFIDEAIEGCGFNAEVEELTGQFLIAEDEHQFFEKVIPEPRTRQDVEVIYSDRIRVGMGKHFHDYLVVAEVAGKHYVIQYNENELPDGKSILEPQPHHNFTKTCINPFKHNIIESGINSYKFYNNQHVNSFSFLVGYCANAGLDLYQAQVFEL